MVTVQFRLFFSDFWRCFASGSGLKLLPSIEIRIYITVVKNEMRLVALTSVGCQYAATVRCPGAALRPGREGTGPAPSVRLTCFSGTGSGAPHRIFLVISFM